MDAHICNRDTCSTKAVGGPKINCVECERECFLFCYGFVKCGQNAVKLPLSNGACIGLDPNKMCFTCGNCDNVLIDDAVSHKIDITTGLSKPDQINQETQTTYPNISMNRMADDLADLKSVVSEIMRKMDEPRKIADLISNGTSAPTGLNKIKASNGTPSFAAVLRAERHNLTQQNRTPKRNNDAMNGSKFEQFKLRPPAKVGTRIDESNLVVAASVSARPTFSKSIHVSRVGTSVTSEKMESFIENHANMKRNIDFKSSLLVKKGADWSTLTFVSYKIDVTDVNFDQLMQESFWSKGLQIRPFIPKKGSAVEIDSFLNTSADGNLQPSKIPRVEKADVDEASRSNAEVSQTSLNNRESVDLMDFQTVGRSPKKD